MDDDYASRVTSQDASGVVSLSLDFSSLRPGLHYLNFRAVDTNGRYSPVTASYFLRTPYDAANALAGYEYWVDDDYASRVTSQDASGVVSLSVDFSSLRPGLHYLNFRAVDANGRYSPLLTHYFLKPRLTLAGDLLVSRYAYWTGDELGGRQIVDVSVPANPLVLDVELDIADRVPLPIPDDIELEEATPERVGLVFPSEMLLHTQFQDNAGQWSTVQEDTFAHDNRIALAPVAMRMNEGTTIDGPASDSIAAFRVEVTKEDSVYWQADRPCRLALYAPDGRQLAAFSADEALVGKRVATPEPGSYYALLHSVDWSGLVGGEPRQVTLAAIGRTLSDTLHVNPAGTLPALVEDPEGIVNLTLTGYLNGTDIRFIRSLPNLRRLDIGGARIVEGGDTYYEDYRTSDDVTGDYMFCHLPGLVRLVLSAQTVEVGRGAMDGCSGLTEFTLPASVQAVGDDAFARCAGLLTVWWEAAATVTDASFADMGSPNCLVYAPQGTLCEREYNVVLGDRAERLSLTHGADFCCPRPFLAAQADYVRTFSRTSGNRERVGGWETIVLPFDVQRYSHPERGELAPFGTDRPDARPFWLAELTPDEGFAHTTELKANRPYILSMPNSAAYEEEFNIRGEVTFHADNAQVHTTLPGSLERCSGPEFVLVPTFASIAPQDTVYALNSDSYGDYLPGGVFLRGQGAAAFEAYVVNKSGTARAPLYYEIGGSPTGIYSVECKSGNDFSAYSCDGVLYVETVVPMRLYLYAANGLAVRLLDLHEGRNEVHGLDAGVYVLKGQKVLVGG